MVTDSLVAICFPHASRIRIDHGAAAPFPAPPPSKLLRLRLLPLTHSAHKLVSYPDPTLSRY